VYLAAADGTVVALLTSDAVRLPNGIVVAESSTRTPFAQLSGEAGGLDRQAVGAHCGGGEVQVGPLTVRATRWWAPRRPRPPADPARLRGRVRAFGHALGTAITGRASPGLPAAGRVALAELTVFAARNNPQACLTAAQRLVGLGPGLTPSGDDALSGFLLALRHLGNRPLDLRLRTEGRTPDLSAALLEHAARGDGCDQVVGLLDAVAGHTPVHDALADLLSVGHTSGADLSLGVLAGAHAVLAHRLETTPQWKESL
jgi:hypothetical protein